MSERKQLFLRRAWALCLAGIFVAMVGRAFSPLSRTWDLTDTTQTGQLTVYDSFPEGGMHGLPVEIGDYDGDGFRDLVLAPMAAASAGTTRRFAGEVYVYRGDGKIQGVWDRAIASTLPRSLTIWGARAGDYCGTELFTADVNGDHIDDLIIGAQNYDGLDGQRDTCGGAFIVLGRPNRLSESRVYDLATLPQDSGIITIVGARPGERFGFWVEAGDLDGDGFADLLISSDQAPAVDANAQKFHNGLVTVIYGRAQFPPVIDLAEELPGTSTILGIDKEDHFGSCIHARDLNGDGRDDLIASAALNRLSAAQNPGATSVSHSSGGGDGPDNTRSACGDTYVIFGPKGGGRLPPVVDLGAPLPPGLQGRVTTIYGPAPAEALGEEITTGDFNGDGMPDLALGALLGRNPQEVIAGTVQVIYWKPGLEGATIDLSPAVVGGIPDGVKVSSLFGLKRLDLLGDTLSAADINHDGFDDLAVGIPHEVVNGKAMAGIVAVVFGKPDPWPRSWSPQADPLPPELQVAYILGAQAEDLLSYSMEAKDYDDDGYADVFPNGMKGDGGGDLAFDAGEAYLVSGYRLAGLPVRVESVAPAQGTSSEETAVAVTGTGFTTDVDTHVFAADAPARRVHVLSAMRLEAVLPPRLEPGKVSVRVTTRYGTAALADGFEYLPGTTFIRGDANLDAVINLTDPIATLMALFRGVGLLCPDASDADDNGRVDATDALYVLQFLFLGTAAPPAPFPEAGSDPTQDEIGCR